MMISLGDAAYLLKEKLGLEDFVQSSQMLRSSCLADHAAGCKVHPSTGRLVAGSF